jgi:hypothetical protein
MENRLFAILLGAAVVAAQGGAQTVPALAEISPLPAVVLVQAAEAQTSPAPGSGLPLPSPVEKELAARASNVTEVTLGKNMLAFASKFMNGKDEDEAATRKLIDGLDGVYVREYEFDKEGEYSADEIDKLRQYFETSEWTPIVKERSRKDGENTDVMMKLVNGETHGMFILEAEPKELTIVLILGPIHLDDLHKLTHIGGLGALGDVAIDVKVKDKDKEKDKGKKGGTE